MPPTTPPAPSLLPRDLDGGLRLRQATPADTEALAIFNATVHLEPDGPEFNKEIAAWVRELMSDHPTCGPADFTLVENVETGEIVSSLVLLSQTWSYGGISFGVGRPELVGTLPAYRKRGLVRLQMEQVHEWSAARGELVQAITGIPFYYRQFGYEMTVELGGGRRVYPAEIPLLAEGIEEPFRIRAATEGDLPFILEVETHGARRSLVTCVRNEAAWRYELQRDRQSVSYRHLWIIESKAGDRVGLFAHPPHLWGQSLALNLYELAPGISWLAVTPSVLRHLWATGVAFAAETSALYHSVYPRLGTQHPVYHAAPDPQTRLDPPYALFMRVPDLPAFLHHIAPVLEQRLAASIAPGHTGDLRLSFYRSGLRLRLEQGRVVELAPWQPTLDEGGDAAFPNLTFLHLLFGHRSLLELTHAFADFTVASNEIAVLLDALFPKQPSSVWPLS